MTNTAAHFTAKDDEILAAKKGIKTMGIVDAIVDIAQKKFLILLISFIIRHDFNEFITNTIGSLKQKNSLTMNMVKLCSQSRINATAVRCQIAMTFPFAE
jgi:hypothetical protein